MQLPLVVAAKPSVCLESDTKQETVKTLYKLLTIELFLRPAPKTTVRLIHDQMTLLSRLVRF